MTGYNGAMPPTLRLPRADGTLASYTLSGRAAITPPTGPITSRIGMAAVHVVADPVAAINPTLDVALDWDATLRYRHYVWSLGLAVAEAMDTSQRGMGFDWPTARELIRRSVAEARTVRGAVLASGAGTDQLAPGASVALADVEAAYEEQCSFIEGVGGRIILMASRALAACARGPEDYEKVYARILAQRREIAMRARFPKGVRMYTGDDFDYPTTIRGDGQRASDALLGIFDVIAPAASAALHALDAGDVERFEAILAPTLTLSRHVFGAPTRFYKTGVVFAAYLNGHQAHFRMVGGLESARSVVHVSEQLVLMDRAGLLRDPDLAAERMRRG